MNRCEELAVCQHVTKTCPSWSICAKKDVQLHSFIKAQPEPEKVRGHVRRSILWNLLQEGQLGVKSLAERAGCDTNVAYGAVLALTIKSLVVVDPVKVRVDGARSTVQYGLTRRGIEVALELEPVDASADGIPADLM
jgi:hypothetical protein